MRLMELDPSLDDLTEEHLETFDGLASLDVRDRSGLEQLIRYMARPAIATGRLSLLSDSRVSFGLRRSWNDGTHTVVFQSLEFIEKLAAMVPPPRAHLLSYHGVFGPNAARRSEIVPRQTNNHRATRSCCGDAKPDETEESRRSQRLSRC